MCWKRSRSTSICICVGSVLDLLHLRDAVNQMKYSITTNLGCHHLWLTLGHREEGSDNWLCYLCSQSGAKKAFLGGDPAFAFSHTAESRTEHHLHNAEDKRNELQEVTVCRFARAFTWAGAAAPEVLFGEQTQGSAVHLKASLLRPP